jgi:hypothetical protein
MPREGRAGMSSNRDAIIKCWRCVWCNVGRRGIHDVVSSFSWLDVRLVISSRGRCWQSFFGGLWCAKRDTWGSGRGLDWARNSLLETPCKWANLDAQRGDLAISRVSMLGTGDVTWTWEARASFLPLERDPMATHMSMESVPLAKLKPPCGCCVPRA